MSAINEQPEAYNFHGTNCGLVCSIFTLSSEQKALKLRKTQNKLKKKDNNPEKTRGYSTFDPAEHQ
jgi:hypothetical protein